MELFQIILFGFIVLVVFISWVSFLGGIGQSMIDEEKEEEKPVKWGRGE